MEKNNLKTNILVAIVTVFTFVHNRFCSKRFQYVRFCLWKRKRTLLVADVKYFWKEENEGTFCCADLFVCLVSAEIKRQNSAFIFFFKYIASLLHRGVFFFTSLTCVILFVWLSSPQGWPWDYIGSFIIAKVVVQN